MLMSAEKDQICAIPMPFASILKAPMTVNACLDILGMAESAWVLLY